MQKFHKYTKNKIHKRHKSINLMLSKLRKILLRQEKTNHNGEKLFADRSGGPTLELAPKAARWALWEVFAQWWVRAFPSSPWGLGCLSLPISKAPIERPRGELVKWQTIMKLNQWTKVGWSVEGELAPQDLNGGGRLVSRDQPCWGPKQTLPSSIPYLVFAKKKWNQLHEWFVTLARMLWGMSQRPPADCHIQVGSQALHPREPTH